MVTVTRRPFRLPTLAVVALVTLAAGLAPLAAPPRAEAALWSPYTKVYSATLAGKVLLRGNSVVTCDPDADQCQMAKANRAKKLDDQDNVDRYVDVDTDRTTFNSSSALVPLSTTAQVVFAGLYWGGDAKEIERPADPNRKTVAKIKAPGSSSYVTVTSTSTGQGVDGSSRPYQGFADVTPLVAAAGSGTYTVADIATTLPGGWGGWALVVAYADSAEPVRTLNVFNGFGTLQDGSSLAAVADGFVAPSTGVVAADVGTVVWDGDGSQTGESLTVDGTAVGDAVNPAANVFNSSITTDGKAVSGRLPADANTFGTDVDRVRVPVGGVADKAVSARVRIASSGDTVHAGPIVFQSPVQAPSLVATGTVSTQTPKEGATLTYGYTVDNRGLDTARAARLVADVPLHTKYVAGSLTVGGKTITDKADKDAAAYAKATGPRGQLSVGLGSGATSAAGGTLAVKGRTTVSFKVKVDSGLGSRTEVVGVAQLSSASSANGQRVTAVTRPTLAVVTRSGGTGHAPVAAPDAGSMRAEYFGSIVVDPLENDRDADRDAVTVGDVTAGAYGEASTFENTLSYQYSGSFVGLDVVTYALDDGDHSSTGVALLTVMNNIPTARPDTSPAVAGDPNEIFPLSNDSDPNNDPLEVTRVSGLDPKKAKATITGTGGDAPNDTILLTPAKGYTGSLTFSYVITDARGATASSTVTVTVTAE